MADDPQQLLDAIADEIRAHASCGFDVCGQVTNFVPGEGSATASVVVVGEAPGANEDREGRVLERDGRALFPMHHPAAALHNQSLLPTLQADARALREVLRS